MHGMLAEFLGSLDFDSAMAKKSLTETSTSHATANTLARHTQLDDPELTYWEYMHPVAFLY